MTGKSDNQVAFEIQRLYSCVSRAGMMPDGAADLSLKQWLCKR
ncbi:hypothetical protein [Wolbachia endosymbiont of Folsomia candida]|nr:hypothetical protein [Wolbachia endosymbiont of Folsomia candida]